MALRQSWYSWFRGRVRNELHNWQFAFNKAFLGISESGKTYLMAWLIEYLVQNKLAKVFILNCTKQNRLEEALTFLFPNAVNLKENGMSPEQLQALKSDAKKIRNCKNEPMNFKVKIFVPLSKNLPDKLPSIFVPFTISVNDLTERCLQVLYGDKDIARIKSIYDTNIRNQPNTNYAILKNKLRKYMNTNVFFQAGFGGVKTVYFAPKAQKRTILGFLGRLQLFNQQGILASPDFKHNLRNLLREELKDPETIVVLDTHYLKNTELEYFAITYFTETIISLINDEGMKEFLIEAGYKIIFQFDEVRFLFPSVSEHRKGVHVAMSDLGADLLTEERHSLIETWVGVQSPLFIPSSMFKNLHTKFVTRFNEKDDLDWMSQYYRGWYKEELQNVMSVFERFQARGDYRFLILEEPLDKIVLSSKQFGWGFKLPRPRLSWHRKLSGKISTRDWSVLDHDDFTGIDLGIKVNDAPMQAKQLLADEFELHENELVSQLKEEKRKREAKEQAILATGVADKEKSLLQLKELWSQGITSKLGLADRFKALGFTNVTRFNIGSLIEEARLKGLIE